MRRHPLVVLLVALPATLALAAGVTTVSQQHRAFAAKTVELARGDSIRFTNDDEFVHQIYVESPQFTYESDEQFPGKSLDVRFPVAGGFDVLCHIHPKMKLHVDVH